MQRRKFIKSTALATAGVTILNFPIFGKNAPSNKVILGIMGVNSRGNYLAENFFDPREGHCDWGHDSEHIRRMLAMRSIWWADIVAEERAINEISGFPLDLAILFHDLHRSKWTNGKGAKAESMRAEFSLDLMHRFNVDRHNAGLATLIVAETLKPENP